MDNNKLLKEILGRVKRMETEIYGNGNPISLKTEVTKLKNEIMHLASTNKWQTISIITIIVFLLTLLGVDKIPQIF